MQKTPIENYHGYAVHPSAHRMSDGYFSSNLVLERPCTSSGTARYQFYSLEYFSDEHEAIRHSHRWAHKWIDGRG
ncbi:hypothetical protein BJG93_17840 [Paraburkholderia sprentiae WSM5005]|uniref:Transcriptional regulator n=1 Tax=Paraburkholderia sprentiae WSM5005 TaxID=754502 RepID=A0A1I9YM43_9BURK|nr:hypothetical protein [Paraburkholderia sprentiae]APA87376.1 hypothetical protein BJG93_17840 [Paraburkholderia sprentiae WSM5005]